MKEEIRLRTSFADAFHLTRQAEELMKALVAEETLSASFKEVKAKLRRADPTMFFWGPVSQGKTTLVNCLAGQEIGKTGPEPTTSRIKRYPCCEHVIYDAPGGDGLPEHDLLVEEAEQKGDVFLCVLAKRFDQDNVARSVMRLVQRGKGVIIVLNDMNNYMNGGPNDFALLEIIEKIRANLAQASMALGCDGLDEFVPIIPVDADLALVGKLTGDSQDVEESGLPELERHIDRLLIRGKGHILSSAMGELVDQIQRIREGVQDYEPQTASHEQRIREIEQIQQIAEGRVRSATERVVAKVGIKIHAALQTGSESAVREAAGNAGPLVEEEIYAALKEANTHLFRSVQATDMASVSTAANHLNPAVPDRARPSPRNPFASPQLALQNATMICAIALTRRQLEALEANRELLAQASIMNAPMGTEGAAGMDFQGGQFDSAQTVAFDPSAAGDALEGVAVASEAATGASSLLTGLSGFAPYLISLNLALGWLSRQRMQAEGDKARYQAVKERLSDLTRTLHTYLERVGNQAIAKAFEPLLQELQQEGKELSAAKGQRTAAFIELGRIETAATQMLERVQRANQERGEF